MTTLPKSHPELFSNPTLGEAVTNRFLDEVELQEAEDRSARAQNREPLIARREVRYPSETPSGSVHSNVHDVVNLVESGDSSSSSEGDNPLFTYGD
jgi:hypothetical protein